MTSTRFKKGQSGNPSGRPKVPADVKAALAAACPRAVQSLVELLDSPNEQVRLRASVEIINRHLGPPATPQEQTSPEDQQRRMVVLDSDVDVVIE